MLIVPPPDRSWPATENWLESPSTGPLMGNCLMSSTTFGVPRFSISSLLITVTGMAASSGVPAMSDPVTTTVSSSVTWGSSAWAAAEPAAPSHNPAATSDAPQKYLLFIPISSLGRFLLRTASLYSCGLC